MKNNSQTYFDEDKGMWWDGGSKQYRKESPADTKVSRQQGNPSRRTFTHLSTGKKLRSTPENCPWPLKECRVSRPIDITTPTVTSAPVEDPRLTEDLQTPTEKIKRVSDDEYNIGRARLYMFHTDPTHYPTTVNCGVTKKSERVSKYRRNLDWRHPWSAALEFELVAEVPAQGKIVEAALHARMSNDFVRHGKREEWTVHHFPLAVLNFKEIIKEFGGEILKDERNDDADSRLGRRRIIT